jgi:hypothetical protein
MLTRRDVHRITCEEGLEEFADSLVGTVRPGWRLDVLGRHAVPPGSSKIGGDADCSPDESWPANHRGVPMTFLAQLNGDEFPDPSPEWRGLTPRLPAGVLLRVFGDLVDCPFEPGPARVLTTSNSGELVRRPAPAIPTPWPAGGPVGRAGS